MKLTPESITLIEDVYDLVSMHFEAHESPIQMRALSSKYARRAVKHGGFQKILRFMTKEGFLISDIKEGTGGEIFFPGDKPELKAEGDHP